MQLILFVILLTLDKIHASELRKAWAVGTIVEVGPDGCQNINRQRLKPGRRGVIQKVNLRNVEVGFADGAETIYEDAYKNLIQISDGPIQIRSPDEVDERLKKYAKLLLRRRNVMKYVKQMLEEGFSKADIISLIPEAEELGLNLEPITEEDIGSIVYLKATDPQFKDGEPLTLQTYNRYGGKSSYVEGIDTTGNRSQVLVDTDKLTKTVPVRQEVVSLSQEDVLKKAEQRIAEEEHMQTLRTAGQVMADAELTVQTGFGEVVIPKGKMGKLNCPKEFGEKYWRDCSVKFKVTSGPSSGSVARSIGVDVRVSFGNQVTGDVNYPLPDGPTGDADDIFKIVPAPQACH